MAELEKAGAKPKKKLAAKIITKVDNDPADVVQYVSEGRDLYFNGDKELFLELPSEVYKLLPMETKRRYDIEKSHFEGNDVVSDATPEAFNLPFNVRPDAANRQLAVTGAKKDFDQHWARPDKIAYHQSEGWVINHDPNAKTVFDDSCSYKTVGGQNSPELVLMERPKEVSKQKRLERKALRDGQVQKTQGQFRETAESLGVKATIDSTNGVG